VKTKHGYVGRKTILARLSMITTDLAISPEGALYVSCHSGGPDWGTGPNGPGKIFKITYVDATAPQPVLAWAASPTEVRVSFDKPLDPGVTNAFASSSGAKMGTTVPIRKPRHKEIPGSSAAIEFGQYVSAGDRFELLKPPYRVVQERKRHREEVESGGAPG
jgi:hypothetical protein